jgi:hypothetical protein
MLLRTTLPDTIQTAWLYSTARHERAAASAPKSGVN